MALSLGGVLSGMGYRPSLGGVLSGMGYGPFVRWSTVWNGI